MFACAYGWLSMRRRRSSFTTSRWFSKPRSLTTRRAMRSACSQKDRLTRLEGRVSKYAVRSVEVVPLYVPPALLTSRAKSPLPRFSVSSKTKCSKKCANPVLPGTSCALPTWYHMWTATTGAEWSSLTITRSPLSSEKVSMGIGGSSKAWACAGPPAEAAQTSARHARTAAPHRGSACAPIRFVFTSASSVAGSAPGGGRGMLRSRSRARPSPRAGGPWRPPVLRGLRRRAPDR